MAEHYFGMTDTGRQRQNNEDAFIAEPVARDTFIAACVIDGVGGYEGGEVAAAIAREAILTRLSKPSKDIGLMLKEALLSANEKIVQEKRQASTNDKMACVLTVALIEKGGNKFHYAHVGDTRLYLFRDGSLVKITKDHSFVGFLEDSGRLTEEAAMSHPKRNEINKALGFEAPLADDNYIEVGESPFLPGDQLLLCSDGLTDMVDKAGMTQILSSVKSLESKAATLVKQANEAGGKDNITVVLVQNAQEAKKQTATRPVLVKRQEVKNSDPVVTTQTVGSAPKGRNNLLLFLLVLTLLSLAGFFWQWREKARLQNEVLPQANPLVSTGQSIEDRLSGATGLLQVPGIASTDTVRLSKPLFISADSLHLQGSGATLIGPDSSKATLASIYILPSVKYLLLDSLVLLNTILYISEENRDAVHFNQVRFSNSGVSVGAMTRLGDSLFSGSLPANSVRIDSSRKTKVL